MVKKSTKTENKTQPGQQEDPVIEGSPPQQQQSDPSDLAYKSIIIAAILSNPNYHNPNVIHNSGSALIERAVDLTNKVLASLKASQ